MQRSWRKTPPSLENSIYFFAIPCLAPASNMQHAKSHRVMCALFSAFLFLLPSLTTAWGETGSGRLGSGQCPNNTEAIMVYSPFKPYWKFETFAHNAQKCWVATDCLFEEAGESRKQQFSATALVTG